MSRLIPGPREGWLSLLLLGVVVLTPAVSLADAAWVEDLNIAPQLAFFALLIGTILAKLPVRGWIAHLFAAEYGIVLTGFYFAAGLPGNDWLERVSGLRDRIWIWLEAAFGGGISNDTMLFSLLVAILSWSLGYTSAWLVFRRHTVWFALLSSGAALLVHLSYMPPSDALPYFLIFLLASMMLLIRLTLYQRERDWTQADADYNRSISWGFLWKGALLSAAIIALAWTVPTGNVNAAVAENWSQITSPWQGLQGEFDRLFASVGASTVKTDGNRFTKALALKGAIELGPDLVMQVASTRPEYWGTQVFDRYTGQGWMSSSSETTRLESNDERLAQTTLYEGRVDIEQRFRMLVGRSNSLFAATSPVKLSLPANADHFGILDDMTSLKSLIPMRVGQQYAVVSSVSIASAAELRGAGTDYPVWVRHYLQLPEPTGPRAAATGLRRVQTMARRVAANAATPYDAADAIEEYLRGFKYDIKVASPPPDRDAVDWFLFTTKQGYCDYFASAMAVMARSVGIPSRVVSGYNTGYLNPETGFYDVRQENAHSWPELFFPKYGWVRFEPTPSQPASLRPETAPIAASPADSVDATTLEALGIEPEERNRLLLDDGFSFDGQADSAASGWGSMLWPILALLGGLAAAAAAGAVLWRRGMSGLSASEWAYLQMCAVAGLLGWRIKPAYTPAEYGRVLSGASERLRPDVDRVVGSYVEETYRKKKPEGDSEVQRAWQRIRMRLPLLLIRRKLGR